MLCKYYVAKVLRRKRKTMKNEKKIMMRRKEK
jgi:hypothetical protein